MALVTARNVDLSNCDAEQVQFSAAVKPHGCLLVVSADLSSVSQASANTQAILGVDHEELRAKGLHALLGARAADVAARLARAPLDDGPVHIAELGREVLSAGRSVHLFAHRSDGALILEFEQVPQEPVPPLIELYADVQTAVARLQGAASLQTFLDAAVCQVARATGFERVMVYKFLEDGSGAVIAEHKAAHLEPMLGLHFPASDVPAPARRLFAMSPLRLLPDVEYVPVPIVPELRPDGNPLDLSRSLLRSVSVMYTGYLRNMGVRATMVMPLTKAGALCGLIACHHYAGPRHVPYGARMAAELLGRMVSTLLAAKEDAAAYEQLARSRAVLDELSRRLALLPDLALALCAPSPDIMAYISAAGAAVVGDTKIARLGATPGDDDIRALAQWLGEQRQPVFHTDRLGEHFAPAKAYAALASGLLAVRLSPRRSDTVLWFRPEQAETVDWAGDPHKPVEVDTSDGTVRLRPRTSFALWKQSVEGRARPWAAHEIEAARDLRAAIVEVVLAHADELERINRDLAQSNVELDSFAYAASHDLKEPLRGIAHMAAFLKQRQAGRLDDQGREQLDVILRLARRMDDLIETLLQYARVGRAEMVMTDCDLDAILDEVLVALKPRIEAAGARIARHGPLPRVRADKVRVREVLANLVGNAIKYNDKAVPVIEIGTRPDEPGVVFVKDNGIGIELHNRERIFQIFRRLHGRDEYGGGAGAGLTIARKTIERHGGRIWLTSEPGYGTTFYFTLAPGPGEQH